MSGPCPTCIPIECFVADDAAIYSLESGPYPFVLNCPPGFSCQGITSFQMLCCNQLLSVSIPSGSSAAQISALIGSVVAECSTILPFCGGGGPPTTVVNIYQNTPQTCSKNCPDGTTYVYTVPAGVFGVAATGNVSAVQAQNQANQQAQALACQQASLRQICLSQIPPCMCKGTPYSATIVETGGVAPFSFTLISGALPPGLTLNASAGTISGTPTVQGVYSFAIRCTSTVDQSYNQKSYTMTVLAITTTSLPLFTAGIFYSFQLQAAGGSGLYDWEIASGSLPDGLTMSLSGLISGLPTGGLGVQPMTFVVIDTICEIAGRSFFPPSISISTKSTTQIATILGFPEYAGFVSNPPKRYQTLTWTGSSEQKLFIPPQPTFFLVDFTGQTPWFQDGACWASGGSAICFDGVFSVWRISFFGAGYTGSSPSDPTTPVGAYAKDFGGPSFPAFINVTGPFNTPSYQYVLTSDTGTSQFLSVTGGGWSFQGNTLENGGSTFGGQWVLILNDGFGTTYIGPNLFSGPVAGNYAKHSGDPSAPPNITVTGPFTQPAVNNPAVQIAGARFDYSGSSTIDGTGAYQSLYSKNLSAMCLATGKEITSFLNSLEPYVFTGWIGPAGHQKCTLPGIPYSPFGNQAIGKGALALLDTSQLWGSFQPNPASSVKVSKFVVNSAIGGTCVDAGTDTILALFDPIPPGGTPGPQFAANVVFDHNYSSTLSDEYTDAIAQANAVVVVGNGNVAANTPRTTGFVSSSTNVVYTLTCTNLIAGTNYTVSVDFADLTAGTVTTKQYPITGDATGQTMIVDTIPTPIAGHSVQVRNPQIQFT